MDVDGVADTATSVSATSVYDFLDEPWEGWTDEEKDVIKEHNSYYLRLINTHRQKLKEIYNCWAYT